jgi:hypothetical protein
LFLQSPHRAVLALYTKSLHHVASNLMRTSLSATRPLAPTELSYLLEARILAVPAAGVIAERFGRAAPNSWRAPTASPSFCPIGMEHPFDRPIGARAR